MSSGIPAQRKPSRFRAIDDSLNRGWKRLSNAVGWTMFGVVALCLVVLGVEHVVNSVRAAIARYGLLTCLLVLVAIAAGLAWAWQKRAAILDILVRGIEATLCALEKFIINLVVIFHYACCACMVVLIPLFGYLFLSSINASVTSFLTAPIGIKENAPSADYPLWPLLFAILLAWGGYKASKGVKGRWKAARGAQLPVKSAQPTITSTPDAVAEL